MALVMCDYEYTQNEGLSLAHFCLHEPSVLQVTNTFQTVYDNLLKYKLKSLHKFKQLLLNFYSLLYCKHFLVFQYVSYSLSPDVNVINISKGHLVVLAPLLSHIEIFLVQQKYITCSNCFLYEMRCTHYFSQTSFFTKAEWMHKTP